jgi:N2,N2-dimethylguanosine tRNA methyltransferase
MRLAVIREGRALLYIPDTRRAVTEHGGLEPAWLEVFYNPVMAFNRDLSVLMAEAFLSSTGLSAFFVDALAGTGVRGLGTR